MSTKEGDVLTITTSPTPPALTITDAGVSSMSVSELVKMHLDRIIEFDTGIGEKWDLVAELRQEIEDIRKKVDPEVAALKALGQKGMLDAVLLADIGDVLLPRRIAGTRDIRDTSGVDGREIWAELSFRKHAKIRRNQHVFRQPIQGEYGVYSLNDSDGQIVYVGRTKDIWNRLKVHEREKKGWVTWEWIGCADEREAKYAEAHLIDKWKPWMNKRREFPKDDA